MVVENELVVHEVILDAPRNDVFDMFIDPYKLIRWIGISAELDPRPGGVFRFEVMPGQFCEGRYIEIERPSRMVFSWGWTDPKMNLPPGTSRVEVNLTLVGGRTRLRLVHHQLPGELRLLHDDGWSRFLARLHGELTGRPVPYPSGEPETRLAELRAGAEQS